MRVQFKLNKMVRLIHRKRPRFDDYRLQRVILIQITRTTVIVKIIINFITNKINTKQLCRNATKRRTRCKTYAKGAAV